MSEEQLLSISRSIAAASDLLLALMGEAALFYEEQFYSIEFRYLLHCCCCNAMTTLEVEREM